MKRKNKTKYNKYMYSKCSSHTIYDTFKLVCKRLFCDHVYDNGVMNPYIDEYGNYSAIYTCVFCGHRITKTFYK